MYIRDYRGGIWTGDVGAFHACIAMDIGKGVQRPFGCRNSNRSFGDSYISLRC